MLSFGGIYQTKGKFSLLSELLTLICISPLCLFRQTLELAFWLYCPSVCWCSVIIWPGGRKKTIVRQPVRFQAAVRCSFFLFYFFINYHYYFFLWKKRALNAQIFLFFRPCPVSSFLSNCASFPPAVWVGWAYQVIFQHNLTFLPVMCKLPIKLITIKLDNISQTWAIQSILRNIFQTKRQWVSVLCYSRCALPSHPPFKKVKICSRCFSTVTGLEASRYINSSLSPSPSPPPPPQHISCHQSLDPNVLPWK